MRRFFPTAALFLALTMYLGAGEREPNAAQFRVICGKAQDMDHTTWGMQYEELFTQDIQGRMRDALKACASRSKPPFEVDLVFVIAADGKVEHVFADPDQPVAGCVAGKLSREKVTRPPQGDWLQLVNINIKE